MKIFVASWPNGFISALLNWLIGEEQENEPPIKTNQSVKEELSEVQIKQNEITEKKWDKFTEEQKLFIKNHSTMRFNHEQWVNLALMINWQTQPGWPATKE